MPTYRFRNNETGEEFDKWMYMAEREPYLEANPNITQVPTGLNAVSGIGTGEKLPGGFRDNMKRIQEAHPRANLSRFT